MASNDISIFLKFATVLSFLLMIMATSESRSIFRINIKAASEPICESVTDVLSGGTCSGIAQANNLTSTFFDAINPNLNCSALFVGQWLCIDGFIP